MELLYAGRSAMWVLVLLAMISSPIECLNNRPIIGILTQPTDGPLTQFGSSYIAASYVKYVESGGGRVVPVFHNSTADELDAIFENINGLLFPGGGADLDDTPIYYSSLYLYNLALQANDNDDYFPIFGHCMGFELLAILTTQDPNILDDCSAENISYALNLTENAPDSRWIGNAPATVVDIIATEDVCLNNHVMCVFPTTYQENKYLNQFYSVLATNVDTLGNEFISTWEGFDYPIYGMQWHAEKTSI